MPGTIAEIDRIHDKLGEISKCKGLRGAEERPSVVRRAAEPTCAPRGAQHGADSSWSWPAWKSGSPGKAAAQPQDVTGPKNPAGNYTCSERRAFASSGRWRRETRGEPPAPRHARDLAAWRDDLRLPRITGAIGAMPGNGPEEPRMRSVRWCWRDYGSGRRILRSMWVASASTQLSVGGLRQQEICKKFLGRGSDHARKLLRRGGNTECSLQHEA